MFGRKKYIIKDPISLEDCEVFASDCTQRFDDINKFLDKNILVFSSGFLFVSFHYVKKIDLFGNIINKEVIISSWIALALSVVFLFLSLIILRIQLKFNLNITDKIIKLLRKNSCDTKSKKSIEKNNKIITSTKNKYDKVKKILNKLIFIIDIFGKILFLSGIILTLIYIIMTQ